MRENNCKIEYFCLRNVCSLISIPLTGESKIRWFPSNMKRWFIQSSIFSRSGDSLQDRSKMYFETAMWSPEGSVLCFGLLFLVDRVVKDIHVKVRNTHSFQHSRGLQSWRKCRKWYYNVTLCCTKKTALFGIIILRMLYFRISANRKVWQILNR